MPNYTTNFNLAQPLVGNAVDENIWGTQLNNNFATIDSELLSARDVNITSVSTTYTVLTTDRNKLINCDATSGAFTVTLLAAATATAGFTVFIKKTDSSSNAITIDGNSSETIDGSTTISLNDQNEVVKLVCDGSNWFVLGKYSIEDTSTTISSDYVVMPNGLIMQWGSESLPGSGNNENSVTFPLEFPNEILNAQVSYASSTGVNADSCYTINRTTTGMDVGVTNNNTTNIVHWFVIGR